MAKSMRRGTRKMTRKTTRKGTRKNRKASTRRMKRGGGFFTRNSAVAPRSNKTLREGSVAYNSAKRQYEEHKGKVSQLVKELEDAIEGVLRKEIPGYTSGMSGKEIAKQLGPEKAKQLMREKVSIDKTGLKEAQEAIENYLKITAKVKESSIKDALKRAASSVPGAHKLMDFMGIKSETIGSLFDDIDKDELTAAKAATLAQMIKKQVSMKSNNNQKGGADESGAASFLLWSIALWLAIPTGLLSLLVALVIQIIMSNSK
jgi:hypothetical protein